MDQKEWDVLCKSFGDEDHRRYEQAMVGYQEGDIIETSDTFPADYVNITKLARTLQTIKDQREKHDPKVQI
jgi:hypothetical protein